jgi:hypothetical protein
MVMRFRAVVKKGTITTDIEGAFCDMAAREFVSRLSEMISGEYFTSEKRREGHGVSA